MRIYRLENVIQPYAWGSKTAIAELLGLPGPHDVPQAELWMGTHPKDRPWCASVRSESHFIS